LTSVLELADFSQSTAKKIENTLTGNLLSKPQLARNTGFFFINAYSYDQTENSTHAELISNMVFTLV